MLPLSVSRVRAARLTPEAEAAPRWLRPTNVAAAYHAELRALVSWLAVFVSLGVLVGLGYVWVRLKVVDSGYRLSATRQAIDALNQEQHELMARAATLDSPARIADVARTRLGMGRPDKGAEMELP